MARHKISCESIKGFGECDCGIEERRKLEEHDDKFCPKYKDVVLPDEEGNCSLCGARILYEKI